VVTRSPRLLSVTAAMSSNTGSGRTKPRFIGKADATRTVRRSEKNRLGHGCALLHRFRRVVRIQGQEATATPCKKRNDRPPRKYRNLCGREQSHMGNNTGGYYRFDPEFSFVTADSTQHA
jgi:hypothetical protein